MDSDLVVIGGGAAGLGAVRAARRRGASVTLVNDGPLGGDCTFRGCVPSKTLLASARRGLGFEAAMANVATVVAAIAQGEDVATLRAEGVDVVSGRAIFRSPHSVDVDGTSVRSRRFIIATGAAPLLPPIPGLDQGRVLTNESLFDLRSRPEELTILGGGPIGVEMAEAFARLGSRVTLVEAAARLLPREEPEASAVIGDFLVELGVRVLTSTTCVAVEHVGLRSRLHFDGPPAIEADAVLVAVGRRPASGGLGLEGIGVALDARGFVTVDAHLRTSVKRIWAAGDVSQTLHFTHVADETGRIAVSNAFSRVVRRRFHPEWVPAVTFTELEVARVGITESQAAPRSRVAYLPLSEFDRAAMSGDVRGFVKIIVGPRRLTGNLAGGSILGATIVAPRAGEMIHEIVLAMRAGLVSARLATTTHAYPSWSMAIQLTAAQFFGDFGGRRARGAGTVE